MSYDAHLAQQVADLQDEVDGLRKQLTTVAEELEVTLRRAAVMQAKLAEIAGICASAVVAAPLVLVEGTGGEP